MPLRAIHQEQAAFAAAKEEIACGVRASGLETMLHLALEAKSGVKGWAKTYLRQMMNVEILDPTNEAPCAANRVQGPLPDRSA